MKWEVLHDTKKALTDADEIIKLLLKNRGLKTKKDIQDFLEPPNPKDISIKQLGIKIETVKKIISRLKKAKEKKERIVIFGDYDADGVCATAILWETLFKKGYDALPYIPDRFEEGYGFKANTFENPKFSSLKPNLIITVDNGIVAYEGIKKAKKLGIDVIVVDHHTLGDKKNEAFAVFHSTAVCGSALAWFLSRELGVNDGLDLVALGTVADQMTLLGINRSLVKYGLLELNKTKRIGLRALIKSANILNVGVYEIGYILAPRINAMGRLSHALDSLRLICTRDIKKANDLARVLSETNLERQKVVDDAISRALIQSKEQELDTIIVLSGQYHEGIIGLASGKITEKFYRPSIVISEGVEISKASARSIAGFNIIEAIKKTGIILEGGGHPMAAGFSIETSRILEFSKKINEISKKLLTEELLQKKLKIDMDLDFKFITQKLVDDLKKFEPYGQGNYPALFTTKSVKISNSKPVGTEGKHLKLKITQGDKTFDAIWFNQNPNISISKSTAVNIAYSIEENQWNNIKSIQLKIKDIR